MEPIVGSLSFHGLMVIISAICVGLTCLLTLIWVLRHAFQCTNLIQQKLIIRILWVPVWFVVFAFGAVAVYPAAPFLLAVPRLYESFGTVALFQLFVDMVTPGTMHDREAFFAGLPHKNKPNGRLKSDGGSLGWYRGICLRVYQFPLVSFLLFLVTEVLSAKYCPSARQDRIGKAVTGVALTISTVFAVIGVVRFFRRMQDVLRPQRGLSQVVVFKVLLKVTVLQALVMSIVEAAGAIVPTATVSYNDFVNGVPNWMTCMEMLLALPFFLWAFRVAPYKHERHHHQQRGDIEATKYTGKKADRADGKKHFFLRPLWEAFFFWDLIVETASCFRHCCSARRIRPALPHKPSSSSQTSGIQQPVPTSQYSASQYPAPQYLAPRQHYTP